jgi:(R,R)-butanediol dehydrogenase/meso-butanediol dehydrogenase/diacetyl reductase
MRAAVYKGEQVLQVEDIPDPTPGPGQAVMRVKYSAICGTDVHAFMYDLAQPGTVMGHEYTGTIVDVGAGVTRWKAGDRVVGGGGHPPPGMGSATRGHPRFNYRTMGFQPNARPRGYAEYVLLEEWEPTPVPDDVTDEQAALCEPCAVTVHAVRLSDVKLGDAVVVLGAGPIGLLCMQTARAAGATLVIVSEPAPGRAEAAGRLGADAVLNPLDDDLEARVMELTGGTGPQVVFECAAAPSTLEQALDLSARGGQVVVLAIAWEPTPVMPPNWMAREVRMQSSFGTQPEDWRIALELMRRGQVSVDHMLKATNFIPLEGIQSAFESLRHPTSELQMVVEP